VRRAAWAIAGGAFEVVNTFVYLVGELVICPIWDKVTGYDFDAYEAALRQDAIDRAEGL
jgi:hypothetical protein